ncbi:SCO family protein [Candidatus Methylocalor cossyra]
MVALVASLAVALGQPAAAEGTARGWELSKAPRLSVIAPAPDFTLEDSARQPVRLADYRGRVVLLSFIFTSCPSACPLITRRIAALQERLLDDRLLGSQVVLLSVTVDPDTDTPAVLSAYAKRHRADPSGWRFLRETPEKTRAVLQAYDEWVTRLPEGGIDHPARVYLIDQDGRIREIYSLAFFDERQALIDIRSLLTPPRGAQ